VLSRHKHPEAGLAEGGSSTITVVPDGNAAAVAVVEEPSPAPSALDIVPDAPAEVEKPKTPTRRQAAKDRQEDVAGKAEESPEGAAAEEESGEEAKKPLPSRRKTLVREKRMLLSLEEEEALEKLVTDMGKGLGLRVKTSNVLRACVALLFNVQDELSKQCHRTKFTKRPRYDEPASIANFEENIARLLDTAVRNTKSLDR
jgi:hypothetical protein